MTDAEPSGPSSAQAWSAVLDGLEETLDAADGLALLAYAPMGTAMPTLSGHAVPPDLGTPPSSVVGRLKMVAARAEHMQAELSRVRDLVGDQLLDARRHEP